MDGFDEESIREMDAEYERLWARREKYAVISHSPKNAQATGARGRKLIADWANRPRVRDMSKAYCIGSATTVENTIARGALTAVLWLWTPAAPHQVASTPEEAVDWCIAQLGKTGVPIPEAKETFRAKVLDTLRQA